MSVYVYMYVCKYICKNNNQKKKEAANLRVGGVWKGLEGGKRGKVM